MLALAVGIGLLAATRAASAGDPHREALPGIIGQDDRTLLDTREWPWVAIGRVNRETGGFCTGTLIQPDLVVTAAHCLFDIRTERRIAPSRLHFLAGYNRGDFREHAQARSYVTADEPSPGLSAEVAKLADDWALLRLERRLAIRPIPVETIAGSLELLRKAGLSFVGYGQDRAHILSLHRGCSLLGRAAGGRLMVHDCDVTRGGSGSPLLRLTGGSVALVGIAVAATIDTDDEHGLAVPADTFVGNLAR